MPTSMTVVDHDSCLFLGAHAACHRGDAETRREGGPEFFSVITDIFDFLHLSLFHSRTDYVTLTAFFDL